MTPKTTIRSTIHTYICMYQTAFLTILMFVLSCLGIFATYDHAYAQSSMSGGSYILNGGITVFTSELSGGSYTLGAVGDPVVTDSSGGVYTFSPTPFGQIDSGAGSGSGGSSGSVSGGGANGAGYTFYPTSTPTSTPYYPYYPYYPYDPVDYGPSPDGSTKPKPPSRPIFVPSRPTTGVEWIDPGTGVDINFDGIPDVFASTTYDGYDGQPDPDIIGGGQATSSSATSSATTSSSATVKIYDNDLTPLTIILTMLFILCLCFARVIRVTKPHDDLVAITGSDIPVSINDLQTFRISRIPLAILIDSIIFVHKNDPSRNQMIGIPLRDFELEKDAHLLHPNKSHTRASILISLDSIIVPGLAIICMIWAWPISWILSLIFLVSLVPRIIIGKKIMKDY